MPYSHYMTQTQDVTDGKDSHVINIGPHGRIVIPASIRKTLGLKPGDKVVSWIEDNKLIIKPSSLVEKELWAIFKKSNLSSDKLIKERKEEAKREEKKS